MIFYRPYRIFQGLILLYCLSCLSCEEAETNYNDSSEIQRAHETLALFGQAALALQNESEFRTGLYKQVAKSFDGETGVLIKTLVESNPAARGTQLFQTQINQKITDPKLRSGFISIDNQNLFPQIYIPFFDSLSAMGKIGVSKPEVVIYITASPDNSYQGYALDAAGELRPTRLISEQYARENEVWVISFNERVDDEGQIRQTTVENNSNAGRTQSSPSAIVDKMTCKCHKESWAAGGSEVNIITIFSNFNASQIALALYGGRDYQGGQIHEFSRRDVRNDREVDLNFFIIGNWNQTQPDLPYANYVIFEYDVWPTGRRTVQWYLGGGAPLIQWEYRSDDVYYDRASERQFSFSNRLQNLPCISWLSQYQ
jgi:hypothetical protein